MEFRLIKDPAQDAFINMALDEMLLESQSQGTLPTLRFYTWSHPSYSTGYFQNLEAFAQKLGCEKKKEFIVRRITGGGLVYHGKDLTFSLSLPIPNDYFPKDVKDSYLKVNEALREGLKALYKELDYADCRKVPTGRGGDMVCFESPTCYDLVLPDQVRKTLTGPGPRKVVGASQRRMGKGVLHQSAVFLDKPHQEITQAILKGFEKKWGVTFKEMGFSEAEMRRAQGIAERRYASKEWAFRPSGS